MPIVRSADGTRLVLKKGRAPELTDFEEARVVLLAGETQYEAKKRFWNTPMLVAVADEKHNGEMYRFVPRKIVKEMFEAGECVIIEKYDPDFVKCMRAALGLPLGKVAQVRGQIIDPNEIRTKDFEDLAGKLEAEHLQAVADLRKDKGNGKAPALSFQPAEDDPPARRGPGRPAKGRVKDAVPSLPD